MVQASSLHIGSVAADLLRLAGVPAPPGPVPVVERPEPYLPTVFRIDLAAGGSVGALTAAVATVAEQRSGRRPAVAVDGRAAQVSFRSERYLRLDGQAASDGWAALSGDYRCVDGYVRVHANFAHHAVAAVRALGGPWAGPDRDALTRVIAERPALEVESAIIDAGGAAGAWRAPQQWAGHPQGRADAAGPVLRAERIEGGTVQAAPPRPWPAPAAEPLGGVRVLDLTRVIAGPVAGRVLAAHGADVLAVTAAHLPQIAPLVIDTGFGKRSTHLDLRAAPDRQRFEQLVAGADAIVESYRPGSLAALGYGPGELAALSPGIVVADVRAYGSTGPWAGRRGFDSLVQLVSGIAWDGAVASGADHPVALPCQALDHATGWLTALGVVGALVRQRAEGGSWRVEVSLSGTARWLMDLGRIDALAVPDPDAAAVADLLQDTPSAHGLVRHVAAPGTLDGRAPAWRHPPPLLGSSPPHW
jgi:crotonobetainyl-CoA:carnitine CoA-transferase CaiB-like acyl-CoA transferase